ncbi:DgyrCDS8684 [Dimorphilus gyrociliatus]|uniref:DgyrCDS8684 n=1 Tax=Dimorphilus gyrociliatus TaxID=2664684 RepID=A0A7I8VWL2_9ANNE|nr:DgyrCDS8684 [Dimorphilus gyrociliatus]
MFNMLRSLKTNIYLTILLFCIFKGNSEANLTTSNSSLETSSMQSTMSASNTQYSTTETINSTTETSSTQYSETASVSYSPTATPDMEASSTQSVTPEMGISTTPSDAAETYETESPEVYSTTTQDMSMGTMDSSKTPMDEEVTDMTYSSTSSDASATPEVYSTNTQDMSMGTMDSSKTPMDEEVTDMPYSSTSSDASATPEVYSTNTQDMSMGTMDSSKTPMDEEVTDMPYSSISSDASATPEVYSTNTQDMSMGTMGSSKTPMDEEVTDMPYSSTPSDASATPEVYSTNTQDMSMGTMGSSKTPMDEEVTDMPYSSTPSDASATPEVYSTNTQDMSMGTMDSSKTPMDEEVTDMPYSSTSSDASATPEVYSTNTQDMSMGTMGSSKTPMDEEVTDMPYSSTPSDASATPEVYSTNTQDMSMGTMDSSKTPMDEEVTDMPYSSTSSDASATPEVYSTNTQDMSMGTMGSSKTPMDEEVTDMPYSSTPSDASATPEVYSTNTQDMSMGTMDSSKTPMDEEVTDMPYSSTPSDASATPGINSTNTQEMPTGTMDGSETPMGETATDMPHSSTPSDASATPDIDSTNTQDMSMGTMDSSKTPMDEEVTDMPYSSTPSDASATPGINSTNTQEMPTGTMDGSKTPMGETATDMPHSSTPSDASATPDIDSTNTQEMRTETTEGSKTPMGETVTTAKQEATKDLTTKTVDATTAGPNCANGGVTCLNEGFCIDEKCVCSNGWKGETCSDDVDECEDANFCNGGICNGSFPTGSFTYKPCPSLCKCTDAAPSTCDSCIDGYELNNDNICEPKKCTDSGCTECLLGVCKKCGHEYYLRVDKCQPCHASCDGCHDDGPSNCIECSVGYNLIADSCEKTCGNSGDGCEKCTGDVCDKCKPGYEMHNTGCRERDYENQCQSNPCENNGDCEDGYFEFICTCKGPFTGKTCQILPERVGRLFDYSDAIQKTKNRDSFIERVKFREKVPFIYGSFKKCYISSNGYITLQRRYGSKPPSGLDDINLPKSLNRKAKKSGFAIIAPLWVDGSIREGTVYYKEYQNRGGINIKDFAQLQYINQYIRAKTEQETFETSWAFIVTWEDLGPYGGRSSERATFQLLLVKGSQEGVDSTEVYAVFLYEEIKFAKLSNYQNAVGYFAMKGEQSTSDSIGISGTDTVFDLDVESYEDEVGEIFWPISTEDIIDYDRQCNAWINMQSAIQFWINVARFLALPCPCSIFQASIDRSMRFAYSAGGATCFARVFRYSYTCCYRDSSLVTDPASSGHLNVFNPYFHRTNFLIDLRAKQDCCINSDNCNDYISYRPIDNCFRYRPPFFSWGFGDPHVQTLDAFTYTFNGLGEYSLIEADEFDIQARTYRVTNENTGELAFATSYAAYVARDKGASHGFQIQLNKTNNGLTLFKLDSSKLATDITKTFMDTKDGELVKDISDDFSLTKNSATEVEVTLSTSGVTLTFTYNNGQVDYSAGIPQIFRGKTRGLMGNFDGDKTNDLVPKNGSIHISVNASQEEIFKQFGETWRLSAEESLFSYIDGGAWIDYNDVNFIPKFLPKIIPQEVKDKCTSNNVLNENCAFDLINTGNDKLAEASKETQEKGDELANQLSNTAPTLSAFMKDGVTNLTALQCSIGTNCTFILEAEDPDGDPMEFSVLSLPTGSIYFINEQDQVNNKRRATVNWLGKQLSPNATDTLAFKAFDGKQNSSSVLIRLLVCDTCTNGECNFDEAREDYPSDSSYVAVVCQCDIGYEGDNCEDDKNGCEENTCFTNCTDNTAAIEKSTGQPYTCDPCPEGYVASSDKTRCNDVDECAENKDNCDKSSTKCVDIDGSYRCECLEGLKNFNKTSCIDIDECIGNNDCAHICKNSFGNYNCECRDGFTTDNNGKTCNPTGSDTDCNLNPVVNGCPDTSLGCYKPSGGVKRCVCPKGTEDGTGVTDCNDINECSDSSKNLCDETNGGCIDINGGYNCTCKDGFQLDNDKISCNACPSGRWGKDCANICNCKSSSTECNTSTGCKECKDGFEGGHCNNINECNKTANGGCDSNSECKDTIGSFNCLCKKGYKRGSTALVCVEINECDSSPCQNDGECIDKLNEFECKCKPGFQGLTCGGNIDECESKPCMNNGECVDKVNDYFCNCTSEYTGKNCEVTKGLCEQANPTLAGKCESGSCEVGKDGVIRCKCPAGKQPGSDRASCIDFNECDSSPCKNDGECINGDNKFECNCKPGWTSPNCEKDVDECKENKCTAGNFDSCTNSLGDYECKCKSGFYGKNCEFDNSACGDATLQQTCLNDYKVGCYEKVSGTKRCNCSSVPGLTDDTANDKCMDINDCNPNPCTNSGVCIDKLNDFKCNCTEGWTGNTCSESVDDCASGPCKNRAVCKDGANNYTCECQTGYTGRHCEKDIDGCEGNPCKNGGKCTSGDAGKFTCECPKEWKGTICNDDVDECEDASICKNGGKCNNTMGAFECNCTSEFIGKTCENSASECGSVELQQKCDQLGTGCKNIGNVLRCSCPPGKEPGNNGPDDCTDIDECANNPCVSDKSTDCKNLDNDYECVCKPQWTGKNCSEDFDECTLKGDKYPCKNGGSCNNTMGGFKCGCIGAYSGDTCENITKLCDSSPCKNGGECQDKPGFFECKCPKAWKGKVCLDDVDECSLEASYCNGGNCTNFPGNFSCECPKTRTGKRCELDLNECNDNPCENGAPCKNLINTGYTCECNEFWEGQNCDVDKNECGNIKICNGGYCNNTINGYSCWNCPEFFGGKNCADDLNECEVDNPCKNGATCKNKVKTGYTCECNKYWEGKDCDIDINECDKTPNLCQNEGNCTNTNGSFECACPKGWAGKVCEESTDICSKGGLSEKECTLGCLKDDLGEIKCICPSGKRNKKDSRTECIEIDDCQVLYPCQNDAKCVDKSNDYECMCKAGWEGKNCSSACTGSKYGVNCAFTCPTNCTTCDKIKGCIECDSKGHEGPSCSEDKNECLQPQDNICTDRCINTVGSYQCSCFDGKVLVDGKCKKIKRKILRNKYKLARTFNNLLQDPTSTQFKNLVSELLNALLTSFRERLDGSGFFVRAIYGWSFSQGSIVVDNQINLQQNASATNTSDDSSLESVSKTAVGNSSNDVEGQPELAVSDPVPITYNFELPRENWNANLSDSNSTLFKVTTSKIQADIESALKSKFGDSFILTKDFKYTNPNSKVNAEFIIEFSKSYTEAEITPAWNESGLAYFKNECEPISPCLNSGACKLNSNMGYTCECTKFWEGDNCETDKDECQQQGLCQGAGSFCNNTNNGYECDCNSMRSGDHCELDFNECNNNPCKNDGKCENKNMTGFECKCASGWNGTFCEDDVNECDAGICQNNGVCNNTMGSFECNCTSEYKGSMCEIHIGICNTEKLRNDCSLGCENVTISGTAVVRCKCKDGEKGKENDIYECEDIDECQSNPCLNGATCKNQDANYTCECTDGYIGRNCSQKCSAGYWGKECANSCAGYCNNTLPEYCHNVEGCKVCKNVHATGSKCDKDVEGCVNNFCNGNRCVERLFEASTCECYDGQTYNNITNTCKSLKNHIVGLQVTFTKKIFTSDLLDFNSTGYKTLVETIINSIKDSLTAFANDLNGRFKTLQNFRFSNGSIVADFDAILSDSTENAALKIPQSKLADLATNIKNDLGNDSVTVTAPEVREPTHVRVLFKLSEIFIQEYSVKFSKEYNKLTDRIQGKINVAIAGNASLSQGFLHTKDFVYSKGSIIVHFYATFSSKKEDAPSAKDIFDTIRQNTDLNVLEHSEQSPTDDETWKIVVIVVSVVFFVLLLTLGLIYFLHKSGKLGDSVSEYSSDTASESKDYSYDHDMKNKLFPRPQMRTWQTQEGMTRDQGGLEADNRIDPKEGPVDENVDWRILKNFSKKAGEGMANRRYAEQPFQGNNNSHPTGYNSYESNGQSVPTSNWDWSISQAP